MPAIINPMDLSGKSILVTGASSGIGRDTCILLSQLGAKVILVARDEARLNETLTYMEAREHSIRPFDVTDHAKTSSWMAGLATECGPLFGLVHLAGIIQTQPLRFLDISDLDKIIDTNLKSAFSLAQAFRQKSVRSPDDARLVLTASVAGIKGFVGLSGYSATKGAIVAMTKSLSLELARENIRVNCIVPGYVSTEMTINAEQDRPTDGIKAIEQEHPLGIGKPRDISLPIAFLLGSGSRWMTGQPFVIDGGLSV